MAQQNPEEITQWQNVLPGQKSFISPGHSNESVRVYFNEKATPGFAGECKLPLPPGSVIAKAFVADDSMSTLQANLIFFMRKMQPGYHPEGADWEYGVAKKGPEGSYRFVEAGKIPGCVPCHQKYSEYDYVLTIARYRHYSGWWGGLALWWDSFFE